MDENYCLKGVSFGWHSTHQLSERHACALVGLSRDSYRHPVVTSTLNQELLGKIVQTAHERRRWGYPQAVRTDHGPEFISRAFVTWAQKHDIRHLLIQPGSRTQNTYLEIFNGTFRDECLDENWFESLDPQVRHFPHVTS